MKRTMLFVAGLLLLSGRAAWSMTPEARRAYREHLVHILPAAPAFDQWLQKTDELPPDFDALPRMNGLPDPLRFLDGRTVQDAAGWKARRAEIRELFEKYVWGVIPPHPKLERAEVQETPGQGYHTRNVILHFGPEAKATMHVALVMPEGQGPFPVLMGPGLAGGMMGNMASTMLRRGYITASYAGNDGNDDSPAAGKLFPDYDFGTLPRRAWAATMVLDYLQGLPEVDMKRVAIFGYSRDGKQAVIAAALDERITAVIAGSTGVGGVLPFRLAGERNQAESIESTTKMFPDWFHPRLRFFAGREDRLPVDGNLLLAMMAPRPCLMVSGLNDEVANTWGDEQSFHSAMKAYRLLGASDKLALYRLPGFHGANDMEAGLDFLDMQFGRSAKPWQNQFVFPWNFERWRTQAAPAWKQESFPEHHTADLLDGGAIRTAADWEKRAAAIRDSATWMMGEAPPLFVPAPPAFAASAGRGPVMRPPTRPAGGRDITGNPGQVTPDLVNWVIQRSLSGTQEFGWFVEEAGQTTSQPMSFGYNVRGALYYPANLPEGKKLPVVIWLHSYSYPLGYMWVYHRDLHPILALVKAGYAVLAYDQAGFGSRMKEAGPFMDRYPKWSLMGRMVEDARAAVDALQKHPRVDPERIYLFGYAMGGNVALHAAAVEPRVKGVVSICGFTPMRTDTAERGTGGIARYSVERPLLPRLGLFIGREARIPYDYDELLAAIAPRPVLVVQPQLDRDATPAEVHEAVERARAVYRLYQAADNLGLDEPWDYNRLPTSTQDRAIEWMAQHLSR